MPSKRPRTPAPLEKRLSEILDATPDPILMVDSRGLILMVNAQLEAAFGESRACLIGQPLERLLPEDSRVIRLQSVGPREPARSAPKGVRLLARRKDGTEFPAEVTMSPLDTEEGVQVIVAIRDVSERVKADAEIRDLASKLTVAEQQERRRISQVLHDDLQQRLFAIRAHLITLARNDSPKLFSEELANVVEQLGQAIAVTRELSAEISPIVLQGEGLVDATKSLADEMRGRYGLEVAVQSNAPPAELAESVRVVLFQSLRELLFNVVKHARTSQAVVEFARHNGLLRIRVRDEGDGFDISSMGKDTKSAYGLLGIQRRLDHLGCSMRIHSTPGDGTTVEIDVRPEKETT